MGVIRTGIGLMWVLSLVAGRELWFSAYPSPITATSAEITDQADPASEAVTDTPRMEDSDISEPRVDLVGNEVDNALAEYRLDRGGIVYERHSPETAVPKLGSPSA